MKIYTLYDKKLGEYGALVISQNDEIVSRNLRDELDAQSLPHKHPEDFTLVCVGEYDKVTGHVRSDGIPRLVLELTSMFSNGKES